MIRVYLTARGLTLGKNDHLGSRRGTADAVVALAVEKMSIVIGHDGQSTALTH